MVEMFSMGGYRNHFWQQEIFTGMLKSTAAICLLMLKPTKSPEKVG